MLKSKMSSKGLKDRELDEEFIRVTIMLQKGYNELPKTLKIRVEKWLERLAKISAKPQWKQTRNQYIKLLFSCTAKSQFDPPFDKLPPLGDLPKIENYTLKSTIGQLDSFLRNKEIDTFVEAQMLSLGEEFSPRDSNLFTNLTSKRDIYEITPSKVDKTTNFVAESNPEGVIEKYLSSLGAMNSGGKGLLQRESALSKLVSDNGVIMEHAEFSQGKLSEVKNSKFGAPPGFLRPARTTGNASGRSLNPSSQINRFNKLAKISMQTDGLATAKSANLESLPKWGFQHAASMVQGKQTAKTFEKERETENLIKMRIDVRNEEGETVREVATFESARVVMSRARALIQGYLEDKSRVENLEECLGLLEHGEQLCEEEVADRERLTEEDFLDFREKFEKQFDRVLNLEKSEGLNKLINLKN